jgi:hypothetical protein
MYCYHLICYVKHRNDDFQYFLLPMDLTLRQKCCKVFCMYVIKLISLVICFNQFYRHSDKQIHIVIDSIHCWGNSSFFNIKLIVYVPQNMLLCVLT